MLRPREETLLGYMLCTLVRGERDIEVLRRRLHEESGFDAHSIFSQLDRAHKGYLTSHDLTHFLRYLIDL
jgi:hypothetical protein